MSRKAPRYPSQGPGIYKFLTSNTNTKDSSLKELSKKTHESIYKLFRFDKKTCFILSFFVYSQFKY